MLLKRFSSKKLIIICLFLSFSEVQAQKYELRPRKTYTKQDRLRGELTSLRTCFDVKYYHLKLKINPKKQVIEGSNEIHFQVKSPTNKVQIDLFDNLKVSKIT